MSVKTRVFIDSSVLVEAIKGTKTALLERLMNETQYECCINNIVVSEFMFYYLATNTNVSPLTLKMQKKIPSVIKQNESFHLLRHFHFLEADERLVDLVPVLMQQYNILPNDAVIIATCKIREINSLASYDSELKTVCENEGIDFLNE